MTSAQLLGPLLYRELMTADEPDEAFAAAIVEAFLGRHRRQTRQARQSG